MNPSRKTVLLSALTFALPAVAVTATTLSSVPGAAPVATPSYRLVGSAACPDVALVAIDSNGRGWGGSPGAKLRPSVETFLAKAAAGGSNVVVRHYGVKFPSIAKLIGPGHSTRDKVKGAITVDEATKWLKRVNPVAGAVRAEVDRMAAACPSQIFAFTGFQQGAAVAHRVLQALETHPGLQPRTIGGVLVSDPDRAANTLAGTHGNPRPPKGGSGLTSRVLTSVGDVPSPTSGLGVVSVCTRRDPVCDLRGASIKKALKANNSYTRTAGITSLNNAGSDLWARAASWPRPAPNLTLVAEKSTAFTKPIPILVGAAFRGGVVFENPTGLPAGVTLSSTGVLTGTINSNGSATIGFTVRNTAPAGSSTTGQVTLVTTDSGYLPSVTGGGQNTCYVTTTNAAYCAGDNYSGQIGNGGYGDKVSPVQVGTTSDWATISASGQTTCGIKTDGTLWCWGANNRGQLGVNDVNGRAVPTQVGTENTWSTISAAWLHTCATKTNGTLWCWGEGGRGELGNGSRAMRIAPTQVGADGGWISATAGGWHSCGIRWDGSAYCWGLNDFGQLGTGSPIITTTPYPVLGGEQFQSLDASWSSTCGLALGGRAVCWGVNNHGQLGNGTNASTGVPTPVAGGRQWLTVSTGDAHTCGIETSGQALCWGNDRYGQLGDGGNADQWAPVPVAGGNTWGTIDVGWMHACGFTGTQAQCWGNNESGQLAQGNRTNRGTPPGVARRKAAPLARKKSGKSMVVTSFNVLTSARTRPGGGAGDYAPGRIRSEWAADVLESYGSDIVAFQELETDQSLDIARVLGPRYAFSPVPVPGNNREVLQSIMWDTTRWTFVERRVVNLPVLGTTLPNELLRLKSTVTGKNIWVFNVHNSPSMKPAAVKERRKAIRISLREIKALRNAKFPVIFVGDMNERKPVFCSITGRTDLKAVTGGSFKKGKCKPPKNMRFDWMFTSPQFKIITKGEFNRSPYITRITDHATLKATLSIPGKG